MRGLTGPGCLSAQSAQASPSTAVSVAVAGLAAFEAQAAELAKNPAAQQAQLRLLYESAWCYRVLAEGEIRTAQAALQQEALKRVLQRIAKENLEAKDRLEAEKQAEIQRCARDAAAAPPPSQESPGAPRPQ